MAVSQVQLLLGGGGGVEERREGSGAQKCVYHKWLDKMFPTVTFVFFPTMVTLVRGRSSSAGCQVFKYIVWGGGSWVPGLPTVWVKKYPRVKVIPQPPRQCAAFHWSKQEKKCLLLPEPPTAN